LDLIQHSAFQEKQGKASHASISGAFQVAFQVTIAVHAASAGLGTFFASHASGARTTFTHFTTPYLPGAPS
jgi:hypothetical protein